MSCATPSLQSERNTCFREWCNFLKHTDSIDVTTIIFVVFTIKPDWCVKYQISGGGAIEKHLAQPQMSIHFLYIITVIVYNLQPQSRLLGKSVIFIWLQLNKSFTSLPILDISWASTLRWAKVSQAMINLLPYLYCRLQINCSHPTIFYQQFTVFLCGFPLLILASCHIPKTGKFTVNFDGKYWFGHLNNTLYSLNHIFHPSII